MARWPAARCLSFALRVLLTHRIFDKLTLLTSFSRVFVAMVEREPCPKRIFSDLGGAFAMGAIGGSLFQTFKGAKNAPRVSENTKIMRARSCSLMLPQQRPCSRE
jgi:hypothetical protein